MKIALAPQKPHTRSDTSQQTVPVLSNPEKLVSKKGQKPKIVVTPEPTLLAPGSSSHVFTSKKASKKLIFSEEESSPSPIQEPTLEEQSLEFVSFLFTETQSHTVASSSTIVQSPIPISVVSPHSSFPTTGIHFTPAQGAVNPGANMAVPAAPAFLMNRYAPLTLPQPLHDFP